MAEGNKLSDPILRGSNHLNKCINDLLAENPNKNYSNEVSDFLNLTSGITELIHIVNAYESNYTINEDIIGNDVEQDTKQKLLDDLQKFNNGLDDRNRDLLLLLIFQQTIQTFTDEYFEYTKNIDINEGFDQLSSTEIAILNKLCLLIDFQIEIYCNHLPTTKSIFYQIILQILDSLFRISTYSVDKFWYYLESRQLIIQSKLFDKKQTSDRISILEICNKLTDKYIHQQSGKHDSYRKDSFNDKLQNRVRVFITNVFQFEDNTGLNKYFSAANRITKETAPIKSKSWEDNFLQDILQLNKIIRDPYSYVKPGNNRILTRTLDKVSNLYDFLFHEEESYVSTRPKFDQFVVKPKKMKPEADYLKSKYENKIYFPENYWLSAFEENTRGGAYENMKKSDEDYYIKQLDLSKTRNILLCQIYLVCCLFYQLVGSNKRQLLNDIGAPSNVKHITDDSIPETLTNLLYKIRKDIIKRYRSVDSQLGFLLQHIQASELCWWGWLVYNKDPKTGTQLLADKILHTNELKEVADKSKSVLPFKEKRYFNVYGTPSLTRRMKVDTGLAKLKSLAPLGVNINNEAIEALTETINKENDQIERNKLLEERTMIIWKKLKRDRSSNWLQFGTLLKQETLTADKSSKVSSETPAVLPDTTLDSIEEAPTHKSRKRHLEEDNKHSDGNHNDEVHEDEKPSPKKVKLDPAVAT